MTNRTLDHFRSFVDREHPGLWWEDVAYLRQVLVQLLSIVDAPLSDCVDRHQCLLG